MKYKLVLYKFRFRLWIATTTPDGEHTMSLAPLWWAHLKVMSWLIFVLNE